MRAHLVEVSHLLRSADFSSVANCAGLVLFPRFSRWHIKSLCTLLVVVSVSSSPKITHPTRKAESASTTPNSASTMPVANWRVVRTLDALNSDDPHVVGLAMLRLADLAERGFPHPAEDLIARAKKPDVAKNYLVQHALVSALRSLRTSDDTDLSILQNSLSNASLARTAAESLASKSTRAQSAVSALIKALATGLPKRQKLADGKYGTQLDWSSNSPLNSSDATNSIGAIGINRKEDLLALLELTSIAHHRALPSLAYAYHGVAPELQAEAASRLHMMFLNANLIDTRQIALECLRRLDDVPAAVRSSLASAASKEPDLTLYSDLVKTACEFASESEAIVLIDDLQLRIEQSLSQNPSVSKSPWARSYEQELMIAMRTLVIRFPRLGERLVAPREGGPSLLTKILSSHDVLGTSVTHNETDCLDFVNALVLSSPRVLEALHDRFPPHPADYHPQWQAVRDAVNADDLHAFRQQQSLSAALLRDNRVLIKLLESGNRRTDFFGFDCRSVNDDFLLLLVDIVVSNEANSELKRAAIRFLIECEKVSEKAYHKLSQWLDRHRANGANHESEEFESEVRVLRDQCALSLSSALQSVKHFDEASTFPDLTRIMARITRMRGGSADRQSLLDAGINADRVLNILFKESFGSPRYHDSIAPNISGSYTYDYGDFWYAVELCGPLKLEIAIKLLERRYHDRAWTTDAEFWSIVLSDKSEVDLAQLQKYIRPEFPELSYDPKEMSEALEGLSIILTHAEEGSLFTDIENRSMAIIDGTAWKGADVAHLSQVAHRVKKVSSRVSERINARIAGIVPWYKDGWFIGTAVLATVTTYFVTWVLVLVISPVAVVKASKKLRFQPIVDALAEYKWIQATVKGVIAFGGPSVFARSKRSRVGWIKLLSNGTQTLKDLEDSVLVDYCEHEDVIVAWAEAYKSDPHTHNFVPEFARDRFFRHDATISAWSTNCRRGVARWVDVPAHLSRAFYANVRVQTAWAHSYSQGHSTWHEVPIEARSEFLRSEAVLDAWVARHAKAARESLRRYAEGQQRPIAQYIPPIIAIDVGSGQLLEISQIRQLCGKSRTAIAICGEGGSGKTSLAIYIADHAISELESERPFSHLVIPIIVDSFPEGESLFDSIRGKLTHVLDLEEVVDADLAEALLLKRRVALVIDGLSEFSEASKGTINASLSRVDSKINALIITTRQVHEIDRLGVQSDLAPADFARPT